MSEIGYILFDLVEKLRKCCFKNRILKPEASFYNFVGGDPTALKQKSRHFT